MNSLVLSAVDDHRGLHPNHVFRARVHRSCVEPKFPYCCASTRGQRYFLEQGKQTTNLASMNLTKLGALPVSLPRLEEQRCIVDDIERRLAIADRTAAEIDIPLARARRLRQAILKYVFMGRLLPQDPTTSPPPPCSSVFGANVTRPSRNRTP